MRGSIFCATLGATVAALLLASAPIWAVSLLSSFNAGTGQLCSSGFDPATGNVFIFGCNDSDIREFTPAGVEVLPRIPRPGSTSNDFDLDFTSEAVNIGGTVIPANTLLAVNGDDNPEKLYGLNKNTGTVLTTLNLPSASLVGGSYHPGRDTLFAVDFSPNLIREINPSTGVQLNSFSPQPVGSPAFAVFFGDIEVSEATGNLFVVSDSQNRIRELTPTGTFVQDIDVNPLGVTGMSGIAFDDATGEAWISSTNGTVYHLGDFPVVSSATVPEPASLVLLATGCLGLLGYGWRRRPRWACC